MRTTVSIAEPLLRNAKREAAERGITLSELVEDALRGHLARSKTTAPSFRLHTVRGRLVDAAVDLDRTSGLITEDDEDEYSRRGRK